MDRVKYNLDGILKDAANFSKAKRLDLKNVSLTSVDSHTAEKLSKIRQFTSTGISLTGIHEFIENNGGRQAFKDKTTTQVSELVLKMTKLSKGGISYCDYIGGGVVKEKADVFISHAWRYLFLDVVDSIKSFEAQEERDRSGTESDCHMTMYYYFDLFSNNQHLDNAGLSFEWWQTTFTKAIRNIGRVMIIICNWKNPAVFTRSWCLRKFIQLFQLEPNSMLY